MGAQAVLRHRARATPQEQTPQRPKPLRGMAPMMKSTVMSKSALADAIAEACETKRKVACAVLATLASVGTEQTKKNGKFVVPGLCMLKTRKKPAAKAGKREMFGKVVVVKAKPAKTVVKAFPAKAVKNEF